MPDNDKKRQEKITVDAVMQTVSGQFAEVSEHRRSMEALFDKWPNSMTFSFADFLNRELPD